MANGATTQFSYVLQNLVNVVIGAVWALLGLRFILKLFSANPTHEFVNWVYETSGEVLGPFRGIFPSANLDGFIFDFTALFAMLVYGIIGLLAMYLIAALTSPTSDTKKK